MEALDGTGAIVPEPDWGSLFNDIVEVNAASEYWRIITTEMRDRNTLAAANGHSIQRLICSYMMYDAAARVVADKGAVSKPRAGNTKAIARVSPHFTVMREAASDAAALEAELGLSPRRRTAAAKVERTARKARAADTYLRPVAK